MNRKACDEILDLYTEFEIQTVYNTYTTEKRDKVFMESGVEPDEIPVNICLAEGVGVISIWMPNRFEEYTEEEKLNYFYESVMTPEFINILNGIHVYQEGSPSDKDFVSINQLPEWIQKIVIECNENICKFVEQFTKHDKYDTHLCTVEIISEIIQSFQNKEWIGRMYLRKTKGGKSFVEPRIWITHAKQHWDFFDHNNTNLDIVKKIFFEMLRDIEKEMKPKVDKITKPHGLEFVLCGNPVDGIYEFQFNVSKELADIIWKQVHDENGY